MTDRELLEFAAKAAGIDAHWGDGWQSHMMFRALPRPNSPLVTNVEWNPLADDADALRLMVKLQFHVGLNPGNKVFCTPTYSDKPTVFESCERYGVQDPLAATRRAIVRAAAEIGRQMP